MKKIKKAYKILDNALMLFAFLFLLCGSIEVKMPNPILVIQEIIVALDPITIIKEADPKKPTDFIN